jgi:hypothetical protein
MFAGAQSTSLNQSPLMMRIWLVGINPNIIIFGFLGVIPYPYYDMLGIYDEAFLGRMDVILLAAMVFAIFDSICSRK